MELRTVLRDDPAEVRRARRLVSDHLETWGLRDLDQVTILLVSELVTNALLHGHPPLRLVARDILTGVRIEVHDNNPEGAPQKRPDGGLQSGRGLQLVDSLATRWGWTESGSGKCVWFEVDLVWSQQSDGSQALAEADGKTVRATSAVERPAALAGPMPADPASIGRAHPPTEGRPGGGRQRAGAVEGHTPAQGSLAG
ncbi:MAG: ATP-binding protein [Sporichthyaceae bacterium]|nr:ATP-binding protein [Sporichthyaceae bacterium]